MEFRFVTVVPKYLNCSTLSKDSCYRSYLQSALLFMRGVPFIAALNTAALSHRKPVSAGTSVDSFGAQE
jgi:hypothetical protein